MRVKSKKFILSLTVFTISTSMFPINASAQSYQEKTAPISTNSLNSVEYDNAYPNAYIIDWRYKSEDGKIYRRLYNYSLQEWIGEWELC